MSIKIGTPCYIKIIYNGTFLNIIELCDGYPNGVGKDMLEELFGLVNKFRGDVPVACEYWRRLLEKSRRCSSYYYTQEINGKMLLEQLFTSTEHIMARYGNFGIWSQLHHYYWVIDLDKFLFSVTYVQITCTFPLKQIYRILLDKTHREHRIRGWVAELRKTWFQQMKIGHDFSRQCHALMIQKTFRRYICMLRELQPNHGVLFLLAQKRFQERIVCK